MYSLAVVPLQLDDLAVSIKSAIYGEVRFVKINWIVGKGEKFMPLPLAEGLTLGVQTIHRRTEPSTKPWIPTLDDGRDVVELVDQLGFDSIWVGDHLAFAVPILDPVVQLAQAAVFSTRLKIGTAVFLQPLRHPGPTAKQIATLDLLSNGRFIFGLGVGGEFESDFSVAGVPIVERGSRLSESIEVMRKLWSGQRVSHSGRHFQFENIQMEPAPCQLSGPPIWLGGRSDPALRRAARMADGWMSYVVTPDTYRESLDKIQVEYDRSGRSIEQFVSAHLLFARLDKDYETALNAAVKSLSVRYNMDFRRAAERYCALGTAEQIAQSLQKFYEAGARYIILDLVGPYEERLDHLAAFADEVLPLIGEMMP
ncbi:MAG TPA: LLM class F420-dependent oxidoreductase [Gammaproteobacteria bacterium]|jgi:probable F420-dependent oxidoreductase|nr:MAG: LLM class F420-dependent oxidoreductase [Acidithiobacillus sp.]RTZ62092.1 MAG: LLM class F420-dependent oxidoreductase [Gammaproteobacteria bacterium]HAD35616.1 LLM class F420-dependent oxidoreductase [Gammaproteobacteria bacterium]HBK76370.1 LLM class F420-dependent oxidoreductase [Gammaproteobacteria bacterium]HIB82236.1 TIGR03619 family F420-dependent LLM class oxidoreductase [Gammaproteobacteria bacterium]